MFLMELRSIFKSAAISLFQFNNKVSVVSAFVGRIYETILMKVLKSALLVLFASREFTVLFKAVSSNLLAFKLNVALNSLALSFKAVIIDTMKVVL